MTPCLSATDFHSDWCLVEDQQTARWRVMLNEFPHLSFLRKMYREALRKNVCDLGTNGSSIIPQDAQRDVIKQAVQYKAAAEAILSPASKCWDRMAMPRPPRTHQSAKDARVPMHVIVSLVAHLRGFAPVFLLRFVVPYAEASRGAVTVAHRSAIRLPSKRHCTKP